MKYPYTEQIDLKDCGVAALSMVLKYYGSTLPIAKLRDIANTGINGTTILGMKKAAEYYNLQTKIVQGNKGFFESNQFDAPFIIHVIKDEVLLHYYVVYEVKKKYILIADPDSNVKFKKMSYNSIYSEWTGIAMFLTPNKDYQAVKVKEEKLKKLMALVFSYKILTVVTVFSAMVVLGISIFCSLVLQRIVDKYIPNQNINAISVISVGLIISYIFQQIFSLIQNYSLNLINQSLIKKLVVDYIKHVLKLPMKFFSTRRTGEIVSRFNDTNTIIDAFSSTLISVFIDLTMIIVVSVVLLLQNFALFSLVLMAIPVYLVIIVSFFKLFKKLSYQSMQSNSILNASVIEDFNGIETIKSLGVENVVTKKLNGELSDYLAKSFKYNLSIAIQAALKTTINLILNCLILWFGCVLIVKNEATLGQIITFSMLITYFINPLENLFNLQPKLQAAQVAFNRVNEILLIDTENSNSNLLSSQELEGNIEVKNVEYSYDLRKKVLSKINTTIPFKKTTCIVGESGSGKTTLAKLLVRFYEYQNGEIFFNGINLKDIANKDLRNFINYLPQTPYLFNGTIIENLTLGLDRNVNESEIWKVLNLVKLDEEIKKMPMSIHTFISTEGTALSGGQKQRLSLARSLLSAASVLILDEATSQLDVMLEKSIIHNIIQSYDKTIIFITHRLEIAKCSDFIIVLKNNTISESGSYKELTQSDSLFGEMFGLNKLRKDVTGMSAKISDEILLILKDFRDSLCVKKEDNLYILLEEKIKEVSKRRKFDHFYINYLCLEISSCILNNGLLLSEESKKHMNKLLILAR